MLDAAQTVTIASPGHRAPPTAPVLDSWPPAVIAPEDLAIVAEIALMRLPARAAESRRLERMQRLTDAASELGRAMTAQAHVMLVNFRGSHGAGNLHDATLTLATALGRYADLVHRIADEYRRLVTQPALPQDFEPTPLTLVPAGVPMPGRPCPVVE